MVSYHECVGHSVRYSCSLDLEADKRTEEGGFADGHTHKILIYRFLLIC